MVALTYTDGTTPAVKIVPETVATPKSFFQRFIAAMIEARMVQANRELAAFRHVVPHAQRDAGKNY